MKKESLEFIGFVLFICFVSFWRGGQVNAMTAHVTEGGRAGGTQAGRSSGDQSCVINGPGDI